MRYLIERDIGIRLWTRRWRPVSRTSRKAKVIRWFELLEMRDVLRCTKFVRCVGSERNWGNAIFWPSRCPIHKLTSQQIEHLCDDSQRMQREINNVLAKDSVSHLRWRKVMVFVKHQRRCMFVIIYRGEMKTPHESLCLTKVPLSPLETTFCILPTSSCIFLLVKGGAMASKYPLLECIDLRSCFCTQSCAGLSKPSVVKVSSKF